MTKLQVSGLVAVVLAVTLLLAFCAPIKAQSCAPLEQVIADIEKGGGYVVDLIDVKGDHINQIVIFVAKGPERDALIIGGVRNGCMVGGPIAVDTVEPVTPA